MNIDNIVSIIGIVFVIFIMIYFIYSAFFMQHQENMTVIGPTPALAGVNASGGIFVSIDGISRGENNNPIFTQIPGGLSNISCSNGQLYGVNSNNDIYYSPNLKGAWVQIPGPKLTQLSFDGYNMIVVGIDKNGFLFYANKTLATAANWRMVPSPRPFTNVSYSNNQIVAVDKEGLVFYLPEINDSNITNINTTSWKNGAENYNIKQVSFDGYMGFVIGVNNNGEIMITLNILNPIFNKIDMFYDWKHPPGIIYVSTSNNGIDPTIYAIDNQGNIWFPARERHKFEYKKLNGNLKQISIDIGPPININMTPASKLNESIEITNMFLARNATQTNATQTNATPTNANSQLPVVTLTLDPGNGGQKMVLKGTYSFDSPSSNSSSTTSR